MRTFLDRGKARKVSRGGKPQLEDLSIGGAKLVYTAGGDCARAGTMSPPKMRQLRLKRDLSGADGPYWGAYRLLP
jgi:hypothetical protein